MRRETVNFYGVPATMEVHDDRVVIRPSPVSNTNESGGSRVPSRTFADLALFRFLSCIHRFAVAHRLRGVEIVARHRMVKHG